MITISNLKLSLDEEKDCLGHKIARKIGLPQEDFSYKILRESIDARTKGQIHFVYQVEVELSQPHKRLKLRKDKDICLTEKPLIELRKKGQLPLKGRVVVVGSGPAGLFAAYTLANHGYGPLLIERGQPVPQRKTEVELFWQKGQLNPSSNVQFGEGGAGTFSDGKLTSRSKDPRVSEVLALLHQHGAPEEITYSHKPHIGTDILSETVRSIRQQIIRLGGEVRFSAKLESLEEQNGRVSAIYVNGERIETGALLLAIGHSARDTYKMMAEFGVPMTAKSFAMGFRIEHPQKWINQAQYKEFHEHPRLGAADYHLTYQNKQTQRSAYTFCMCPGGKVIGSSSAEEELVVNGMSYHARDLDNANSALLVGVDSRDFGKDPMTAIKLQQHYERLAFQLGGSNYHAPVQRVEDFLSGKITTSLGKVRPSYEPGVRLSDLSEIYPPEITRTLREAILAMDKKLRGFALPDALLTGVETRSSAPLRILRNSDTMESEGLADLYPAGEGAGYAGGIVSSAIDGIKSAEKIMEKYDCGKSK